GRVAGEHQRGEPADDSHTRSEPHPHSSGSNPRNETRAAARGWDEVRKKSGRDRERRREDGAAARRVRVDEVAALRADERARQSETEPEPGGCVFAAARERAEEPARDAGRDTRSAVGDRQRERAPGARERDADGAIVRGARVLLGVVEEVREDL